MSDRNFEPIAERFLSRVHHGSKGRLRRAVLERDLDPIMRPELHVLDVGCGAGSMSLWAANKGAHVTGIDLSATLIAEANNAPVSLSDTELGRCSTAPSGSLNYACAAFQDYVPKGSVDLLMAHAVLEWLKEPRDLVNYANTYLTPGGFLSLCAYNPAGLTFRNLVMGNFHHLDAGKPPDERSLTPANPPAIEAIFTWFQNYTLVKKSGVRVFSDYGVRGRGGLGVPEEVFEKELEYSDQEPFASMGRYLHLLFQKPI